jgi:hypothetical protein
VPETLFLHPARTGSADTHLEDYRLGSGEPALTRLNSPSSGSIEKPIFDRIFQRRIQGEPPFTGEIYGVGRLKRRKAVLEDPTQGLLQQSQSPPLQ